jgi:hypothetical protein
MADAVAMLVYSISIYGRNARLSALGIGRKNQRQSAETQKISDAAIGTVRPPEHLRFEDLRIKTPAGIGV